MLNKWVGMGRITAPLELKHTPSGTSVTSFSIAVDRNYTNDNGERQTDFIDCVAWRQTAEFISRYFGKGNMICVEGALTKRKYTTQDGSTRYATEVVVEKAFFTGEKKDNQSSFTAPSEQTFTEIEDDGELPY